MLNTCHPVLKMIKINCFSLSPFTLIFLKVATSPEKPPSLTHSLPSGHLTIDLLGTSLVKKNADNWFSHPNYNNSGSIFLRTRSTPLIKLNRHQMVPR